MVACAAAPSFAQAVPAYRVVKEASGACLVTLIADATTSDAAPQLVLQAGVRGRPEAVGVDIGPKAGFVEVQFVARNDRTRFVPIALAPMRTVERARLWLEIASLKSDGRPFFLSARRSDGTWESSRYNGIDLAGVKRVLEQTCAVGPPVPTEADLQAAERALRLSAEDMRHIRWVLSSRIGNIRTTPSQSVTLLGGERAWLERYARSVGLPPSRFLNRALADRLLRETFQALPRDYSGKIRVTRHGDWMFYVDSSATARCHVETGALSWDGAAFYVAPAMLFSADRTASGSTLFLDMVTPNPFRATSPVNAIIDGRSFLLQIDEGFIKPRRIDARTVDGDVLRAIRSGRGVDIVGTSATTGRRLTIRFSASGFTNAFNNMMADCRRPALRTWLY